MKIKKNRTGPTIVLGKLSLVRSRSPHIASPMFTPTSYGSHGTIEALLGYTCG